MYSCSSRGGAKSQKSKYSTHLNTPVNNTGIGREGIQSNIYRGRKKLRRKRGAEVHHKADEITMHAIARTVEFIQVASHSHCRKTSAMGQL